MTPQPRSVSRWCFPPATLAQLLLLPVMLGVLLSLWRTGPASLLPSSMQRVLGEKRPLVAQLDGNLLTVIDANTGAKSHQLEITEIRTSLPPQISSHWYDWPAISLRNDWDRKPTLLQANLRFHFDEQFLEIQQGITDGCLHIFVDLQSGRRYSYEEKNQALGGGIVFETIDDWIFVLVVPEREAYSQMRIALSSGLADPSEYIQVIDAISLSNTLENDTGKKPTRTKPTPAEVQRALAAYAQRFVITEPSPPKSSNPELLLYSWDSSLVRNGFEQILQEDSGSEISHSANAEWLYVCFRGNSQTGHDLSSWYWKVNTLTHEAQQIPWPFEPGSALYVEEYPETDAPAVVGLQVATTGNGLESVQRNVLWNLETGRVSVLPGLVSDCQRFDHRLLLDLGRAIAWYDLDRDELQYVRGWEWREWSVPVWISGIRSCTPLLVALGWIAVWLVIVKPLREGDGSRQFGAGFMLLATAALSLEKLQVLGVVITAPVAEWTTCLALVTGLLGLVIVATLRRAASWFLLATTWFTTLGLAVSVALFGVTDIYNQNGFLLPPGTPNSSSIYSSLWVQITNPVEGNLDESSRETQFTSWRKRPEDAPVKFLEKGKPVSARAKAGGPAKEE